MNLEALRGGDLVARGLKDLEKGRETVESLLVQIDAPRLRGLGFNVADRRGDPDEHRLYRMLASTNLDCAHSRYNTLIRRFVSFERAFPCAS